MNTIILTAILSIMATVTVAKADELADRYFSAKNPTLTKQEKDAMRIVKRWRSGAAQQVGPVTGEDGSIQFLYGAQQTGIVCAVLQVCDIALQPGENITGQPHIGDNARWVIEPAITGLGSVQVQHVIIKPLDVGLETTLIIPTDRRTYHLNLKSHRSEYMPKISFIYPEMVEKHWEQLIAQENSEKQAQTIPETQEYLADLDFNYRLSGKARWKPLRVYNDGIKTVIQMPSSMRQTEAPTLLVLHGKDDKDTVMVNYRVQGDRYIVDSVFDKALLIAGVGKQQDRITIQREVEKNSSFKRGGKK